MTDNNQKDLIDRISKFIRDYEADIYSTEDQELQYLERAISLLKEVCKLMFFMEFSPKNIKN